MALYKSDFVGENDLSSTVEIETNNVRYTLAPDGRYGFYTIQSNKGALPIKLQGQFTHLGSAKQALLTYLAKKNRETK